MYLILLSGHVRYVPAVGGNRTPTQYIIVQSNQSNQVRTWTSYEKNTSDRHRQPQG